MNYDIGTSIYTGNLTAWYTSCPHCGGAIHRYPRAAHPYGHRFYSKCLDCTYGAWEHEESAAIMAQRELTAVSGYSVQYPEPPQAHLCPFCVDGPCNVMCAPPSDEAEYLAKFIDGDFDGELDGYVEGQFYTLTERLYAGE